MTLLKISSISKTYPPATTAVANVSFSLAQGEILCLLGPSGCGKTTLLRCIAGLEEVDQGTVRFDGRDVTGVAPHRRDFGMMFQDFALFPHKNVFENVAFGLKMHGDSRDGIQQRVADMLALVDLRGYEERDVAQLSGGEQQRVALARALAPGPRLLLLDEPLGALDRALRERLMVEVRQILKEVGVTAVYVTHDQTEAYAIADRVAVMAFGHIEQIDKPQAIYARPATPFVARFLGFENVLSATVGDERTVETDFATLTVVNVLPPVGQETTILIKPEAARVATRRPGSDSNEVVGCVTAVSFRGRYYQLWFQPDGSERRLMFELADDPDCRPGERLSLSLDPERIIVLGCDDNSG